MFFNKSKHYMVADVGGTKSTLAIIDDQYNIKTKKTYPSAEITSFTDTINQFLREPESVQYKVTNACIAIAGPINSERSFVKGTNLNWSVDTQDIKQNTALKNVLLLNDFEAVGFSIDTLKQEQYVELTNLGVNIKGTIAIIGAGTGLGVSILPYSHDKHVPLASEGGHVNLPIDVNDAVDIKLESYLLKKKLYTTSEDVVSGRGILNIYNFLLTQKVKHNEKIRKVINKAKANDRPALISKYALEDRDVLCLRTLELFIKYLARISRNLALNTLCTELVIAGGIAPKILPALQDMFVDTFVQHPIENIRKRLEHTTIIVITDSDLSLYGTINAIKYTSR